MIEFRKLFLAAALALAVRAEAPKPHELSKDQKAEFKSALASAALAASALTEAQLQAERKLAPQQAESAIANRALQIVQVKLLRASLKLKEDEPIPAGCGLTLDAEVKCEPPKPDPPKPEPKK